MLSWGWAFLCAPGDLMLREPQTPRKMQGEVRLTDDSIVLISQERAATAAPPLLPPSNVPSFPPPAALASPGGGPSPEPRAFGADRGRCGGSVGAAAAGPAGDELWVPRVWVHSDGLNGRLLITRALNRDGLLHQGNQGGGWCDELCPFSCISDSLVRMVATCRSG